MFGVNVAINLPVKGLFKQYTYAVPDEFAYLDAGWRVLVPFGSQRLEGFVVERTELPTEPKIADKIKNVEGVIGSAPWFDAEMLATARWMSNYYMCTLAEAMRQFVPGKTSLKRRAVKDHTGRILYFTYDERLQEKTRLAYVITPAGQEALETNALAKKARARHAALGVLANAQEPLTTAELANRGVHANIVRLLAEAGLAETTEKRILRNSYERLLTNGQQVQLTEEQQTAVNAVAEAITNNRRQTFLLQGITGSGKTEVYLHATARALEEGKQVLMLVPEIALTAQLVHRFQERFGNDIAVAHSKLSQNERGDVWYRMRTGQARILIGVRSAVFAPFENLGLVILDEEHESSYKQEERPYYHARKVAQARCYFTGKLAIAKEEKASSTYSPLSNMDVAKHGVPLLLGSATPDLESYYHACQGDYVHLRLTERPGKSVLPEVRIVDMRQELEAKNYSVLSRLMQQELVRTAQAKEQSIVLLNRRGYSTFVMCRDCGQSIMCPHCAVSMVYHSAGEDMRCHYCGHTAPVPLECPHCHSKRIKFFGTGTQKAQAELEALPDIRVLRMDQDTTGAKLAHEEIINRFVSGSHNVLIGTQMVAKGHDIPNVTLVGVLSADSALNLPDYRAGERAFALLTQAAGRAGRGAKAGRVIFQTYDADNRILQLAAKQDYDRFAVQELRDRKDFHYPPYGELLKITIVEREEAEGLALGQRIVFYLQRLQLLDELPEVQISGPFPALISKVRDAYRFNLLIKAEKMTAVKRALFASDFIANPHVFFDVDPMNVI